MRVEDFFEEAPRQAFVGMSRDFAGHSQKLREDLIDQLRSGPLPGEDDLSCTIALMHLVHEELEAYGTDSSQRLTDAQIAASQRSLRAALERHRITLELPWRNFTTFRSYWIKNDCRDSWQARRDLLDEKLGPAERQLEQLEENRFHAVMAQGVSPHTKTGWPKVDEELIEMRRLFQSATTTQDYRDVGNRCVAVLEALSRTVYDPDRHLRAGEEEPPVDKTKQRIGRYVEDSLAGKDNEEVRGVATKVIALAHRVKHSSTPTRRDAGITADSVILLSNILRRVDQDL